MLNGNFSQLDQEAVTKVFRNAKGKNGLITGRLPNDLGYGILLYDNNGVPSIVINMQKDGTPNVKVAKSGYDVRTADNSQLIFNSSQDIFKIIKKIPAAIPQFVTTYDAGSLTTSGYSYVKVAHEQSFTPLANIYVKAFIPDVSSFPAIAFINSSYVMLPVRVGNSINQYYFPAIGASSYPLDIIYGITDTDIYVQAFYVNDGNSADTIAAIPVTIFLLQETAD